MKLQLIRHATTIIFYNNKKLLVDPILNLKGAMPPIEHVPNVNYNPLVELPVDTASLVNCDAVLLTHTHRDHFDEAAIKLLRKNVPLFCQPKDRCKLEGLGFTDLHPVTSSLIWEGMKISRTGGKHGHGATALAMAPVSGFVLSCSTEPVTYITGDTVWCSKISDALNKFKPEIIVAYSGSAQFAVGKSITMNAADLLKLSTNTPKSRIVVVHMEAWNHCRLSRNELRAFLKLNSLEDKFCVPEDGELISF